MSSSRLLSIITPTFNSANTIGRAIESAQIQCVTDFEMIIIDDCSTDNTIDIVNSYANTDNRIKLLALERNSGAGITRTAGLKEATGKYIAFLDADDFWFEGKLKKQIAQMDKGAIICFNSYLRMTINGNYYGVSRARKSESLRTMVFRNGLGTSSAMFRRDLNGADRMDSIRSRQDYSFWLKLMRLNDGKSVGLQEVLSCYVVGGQSISASPINNFKNNFKMYSNVVGYSKLSSTIFVLFNVYFKVLTTARRYLSIALHKKGIRVFDEHLLLTAQKRVKG